MAHLLVLGASGVSGWAAMHQALIYPTPTTFAKVTGTTNRPVTKEKALLPANEDRVRLVSGIDFTRPVDEVKTLLTEKIPDIDSVTHVIYAAYRVPSEKGPMPLRAANDSLLETSITAITALAPRIRSVVLQTGGKAYGLLFSQHIKLAPPFHESQPRVPDPWGQEIFYYSQVDILRRLSAEAGNSWTFTEVRPDTIIGFVPGTNAMNVAQGLGFYLSLFREVHGAGAKCPYPGTAAGYRSLHTDSSQDIIARMEIFAALEPEKCGGGRAFNVADGEVVTWGDVWGGICAYFGLEGLPPSEGTETAGAFVVKHADRWPGLVEREGLEGMDIVAHNWWFVERILQIPFDRQFDLSSAREVGFKETVDTTRGYTLVFDRMRQAKMIP
ncbi:hypothetical protein KVR01_012722 [Diaporthe batatas]|uniref:uncharacterized protein n=1 Tax=Diaporthe batatas TaxID=748121 RepID=UPI001D0462BF|nr:uncharacterized protein KVR01_012722 [Diaporthe batatas]KAG8157338.1 hypothetical protein KVR01_012722 [Diaporthe batatas]